jgi:alkylation response protein AidB-like acyl-CoA dehydrogenase
MNFDISENQQKFLKKVDGACNSIRDYEEQCYLEDRMNDRLVPSFHPTGMLGCPISKEYGGLGYDMLTYALALERIGREGASMRTFFSVHTSIGQLVLQSWADEQQKKEYLPGTVSGEKIMAFALTEPEAGSDPSSMLTKFERKGDYYVLKGMKHWIGNGTIAGVLTTYAKDPATGKISAFIVEGESKGLKKVEMKDKMGLHTIKNAEIYFDSCRVPKKNLLGEEGQGLNIAYSALIDGRISVAAGAVGTMQDCLNECVRYAKSRQQHGSVLGKKQLIQDHLAAMIVSIESCRWLVYRAAVARQHLHDFVESFKEGRDEWLSGLDRSNREYSELRAKADLLAAIAKFYASNCAFEAANRSVQIFGAAGYKKTARVARHFLDSRATMIYEGANEVLKLKIASQILGDAYSAY